MLNNAQDIHKIWNNAYTLPTREAFRNERMLGINIFNNRW